MFVCRLVAKNVDTYGVSKISISCVAHAYVFRFEYAAKQVDASSSGMLCDGSFCCGVGLSSVLRSPVRMFGFLL